MFPKARIFSSSGLGDTRWSDKIASIGFFI